MGGENFWTLFKSLAHWEFEIFLMVVFDVVLGILIWPRVMKFLRHHKTDDERIADLEKEIETIKSKLP